MGDVQTTTDWEACLRLTGNMPSKVKVEHTTHTSESPRDVHFVSVCCSVHAIACYVKRVCSDPLAVTLRSRKVNILNGSKVGLVPYSI